MLGASIIQLYKVSANEMFSEVVLPLGAIHKGRPRRGCGGGAEIRTKDFIGRELFPNNPDVRV